MEPKQIIEVPASNPVTESPKAELIGEAWLTLALIGAIAVRKVREWLTGKWNKKAKDPEEVTPEMFKYILGVEPFILMGMTRSRVLMIGIAHNCMSTVYDRVTYLAMFDYDGITMMEETRKLDQMEQHGLVFWLDGEWTPEATQLAEEMSLKSSTITRKYRNKLRGKTYE